MTDGGEKAALRAEMRRRRREVPAAVRAASARALSARLLAEVTASPVAVYLATPDEIDLSDFIRGARARGQTLAAPRWNGATYELAVLESLDGEALRRGPMNVLEPCAARPVAPEEIAIWLVPGLAFTADGARLGYGGGWYDRLLARAAPDARRLGVAYPFQIVAALPTEPHDSTLTGVLTMKTLKDVRREIDSVDAELSALLVRRMRLADEVAAAKRAENKPINDPAREAAILAALASRVPADCAGVVTDVYRALFATSKARQAAAM